VTNWSAYEAGLRQRGSLTVWFSKDAVAGWRAEARRTPGGQPLYSALAIETALTLRALFHLAFRQTEGLIGSLMQLLQLDPGPFDPQPAGPDPGSGAAAAGRGPTAPAGRQQRPEAQRARRMVG
jgi:hypothetical protein